MRKYALKVDANERGIVDELRQIPGLSVSRIQSRPPEKGAPDLVVGYGGRTYLYEVKDPAKPPSKQLLTDAEGAWHDAWTGHAHVVYTADDILLDLGIVRPKP